MQIFVSVQNDDDSSMINRVYPLQVVTHPEGRKQVIVHDSIAQEIKDMAEVALNRD